MSRHKGAIEQQAIIGLCWIAHRVAKMIAIVSTLSSNLRMQAFNVVLVVTVVQP